MDKEMYFSSVVPIEGNGKLSNWGRAAVHNANPGLYEGRNFKSFWAGSVPGNGTLWLRFRPDVDALILGQELVISAGTIRASMFAACTEAGSWTNQPVYGMNGSNRLRRQPYYASQINVAVGGTCTGGIETDRLELVAGTGSSAGTRVGDLGAEQITGPGLYHLRLQATTSTAVPFIYRSWWEEIPEVTGWEAFPV